MGDFMRIVQLSDFHLRGDGKLSFYKADTIHSMKKTVEYFNNQKDYELPDFFIISGDLADGGTHEGYTLIKEHLEQLPRPYFVIPGNHDKREFFQEFFKEQAPIGDDIKPYICYSIDSDDARVIVVDTIIPGRHWGGLSDEVAKWLDKKIQEDLSKPTLVFTHHPPFTTGLPAMDEGFENHEEFARILQKHKNIRLCCGHMHTSIFTVWENIPIVTCPPISMIMEVDFRSKDSKYVTSEEKAENFKGGGDRFFLGNPAYLVHDLATPTQFNTHHITLPIGADYSGPWPFKYYDDEKH